jgi:microcystin-dependent protein
VAGGNFDGTVIGGTGGGQNHTLTTAEMPVHNHGVTDPGHAHSYNQSNTTNQPVSGSGNLANNGNSGATTGTSTTGISIQNAGSGNAHTIMNPAIVLPYILRII